MPSFNALFAGFLFGIIGIAGFKIGKSTGSLRKMLLSASLVGFPYFIENSLLLWGIGILLTTLLIFWNE